MQSKLIKGQSKNKAHNKLTSQSLLLIYCCLMQQVFYREELFDKAHLRLSSSPLVIVNANVLCRALGKVAVRRDCPLGGGATAHRRLELPSNYLGLPHYPWYGLQPL